MSTSWLHRSGCRLQSPQRAVVTGLTRLEICGLSGPLVLTAGGAFVLEGGAQKLLVDLSERGNRKGLQKA
jgi:hypothetical protein